MNKDASVPDGCRLTSLCPAIVLSTTASCSTVGTSSSRRDISSEIAAHNAVCAGAWQGLVQEWLQNGGGVGPDVDETRQRIAADGASRLSLMLQQAWGSQDPADVRASNALDCYGNCSAPNARRDAFGHMSSSAVFGMVKRSERLAVGARLAIRDQCACV
ncbi:hypothetical protein [Stenotrophomonas sp.]|uniref:hypothetical protein n=1 Tax=Stenotrophomonas sp. TaxID=69392 RepID=UPI002FC66FA9